MAVRSKLLALSAAGIPNGAWASVYQCPAGRTAIVREFQLMNRTGSTSDSALAVRRGAAVTLLAANAALPTSGIIGGGGRYFVLEPADELLCYLYLSGLTTAACSIYASGAELEGVAP